MINALPKQEMDLAEEKEYPNSQASKLNPDVAMILSRLPIASMNGSASSGDIILPKRSQLDDLMKNGTLSAKIAGLSKQTGTNFLSK